MSWEWDITRLTCHHYRPPPTDLWGKGRAWRKEIKKKKKKKKKK
jgi:hypothetical protein